MEPDEPPRKNYDFKDRAFRRDNPVGSDVPPMPTTQELARMAGGPVRSSRGAAGPKVDDPNDVFHILQQNRAIEQRHGLDTVEVRRTTSRRRRDYWLLLIPSNLLLGVLAFQGRGNPFVLVCGIAGMVVVTLGITWIMWFVMDDY
jgi:hypothetical protein